MDLIKLERHDELGHIVNALTVFRDNITRVSELKKISLLYASMNAMLDSLEQGLTAFGPDGICHDITSKAWIDLFGMAPVGRHIADVLAQSPGGKSTIDNLLRLVFGNKKTMAIPTQELLEVFPKALGDDENKIQDESVSFKYRPIFNSTGKPQSVLVIATDHSEELALALHNKEREDKVRMALRILTNRNQFLRFLANLTKSCDDPLIVFGKMHVVQVKRDIHTLKGTAASYYLKEIVAKLHDTETTIEAASDMQSVWSDFISSLAQVKLRIGYLRGEVEALLGENFDLKGYARVLPVGLLRTFAQEIELINDVSMVRQIFTRQIIGEPIHKVLAPIEDELRSLAERYGKRIGTFELKGENFQILPECYGALIESFTHIARNLVDHAIDGTEERILLGKVADMSVTIITDQFLEDDTEWMRLAFRDDGRGINLDDLRRSVKRRLGENAVDAEKDDQIMQHIFDENTSLSEGISELSGRGIGLNAVKYEAARLGGRVHVESLFERYTRLTIEVPLIWDDGKGRESIHAAG